VPLLIHAADEVVPRMVTQSVVVSIGQKEQHILGVLEISIGRQGDNDGSHFDLEISVKFVVQRYRPCWQKKFLEPDALDQ